MKAARAAKSPPNSPSPKVLRIRERYKAALENVNARLRNYDRAPFLDLLSIYTEMFPSADALEAFAERFPDKYLMGLNALARTAGFTDKTETSVNVNINIHQMSDSQLEDQLAKMASKLGLRKQITIEGEAMGIDQSKIDQAEIAGLPEPTELKAKLSK